MKRVTLFGFLLLLTAAAVGKPVVYTTVAPVRHLIEQVGGGRIDARAAIPDGRSPHDYQPTPSELEAIGRSNLYLTSGMWFETRVIGGLIERLNVPHRAIGATIARRVLSGNEADGDDDHDHRGGDDGHAGEDPHIWMSPANDAQLASDIATALSELDPVHAEEYAANAEKCAAEYNALAAEFLREFQPYAGRAFFVYHPAFGYFADAVGLRESAIEAGGKTPTPRQLRDLVKTAQRDGIRTIFIQPQFNPAPARTVAAAIGAEVAAIDPLAPDLPDNLRRIADALLKGFRR